MRSEIQDVMLVKNAREMLEMSQKIEKAVIELQAFMVNFNNTNALNYKNWKPEELYQWILSIKDNNNIGQSLFANYSLVLHTFVYCLFLFFCVFFFVFFRSGFGK